MSLPDGTKLAVGVQCMTRDGKRAVVVDHSPKKNYPFLVWFDGRHDNVQTVQANGLCLKTREDPRDLVGQWPETIVCYLNLYLKPQGGLYAGQPNASREVADSGAASGRVGCQRIELTIGTWDD